MNNDLPEIVFLKERYASARNKYKPRQIRVLLLAEGPPDSLDRHFYFEDVKKQDSLFLEIMGVLYPEQKKRYLASGRETELKQELLSLFQEDGYFLLDLADVPCSLLEGGVETEVPELLKRLPSLLIKKHPLFLSRQMFMTSVMSRLPKAATVFIPNACLSPEAASKRFSGKSSERPSHSTNVKYAFQTRFLLPKRDIQHFGYAFL